MSSKREMSDWFMNTFVCSPPPPAFTSTAYVDSVFVSFFFLQTQHNTNEMEFPGKWTHQDWILSARLSHPHRVRGLKLWFYIYVLAITNLLQGGKRSVDNISPHSVPKRPATEHNNVLVSTKNTANISTITMWTYYLYMSNISYIKNTLYMLYML